jgi:hypothetical protein
MRREHTEVAPIVTADTVDEALVSAVREPLARPVEAVDVPAPKEAPREAVDAGPRHRRRRRRRKGSGPTVAAAPDPVLRPELAAAPRSESASNGETESGPLLDDREEPPAFSQGPDDEVSDAGAPVTDDRPGPALPRLAELPATDRGPQSAHRRRRRRRRRRGRGGSPGAQALPTANNGFRSPSDSVRAGATPYGNGPATFGSSRQSAHQESEPAPRAISVEPSPEPPPPSHSGEEGTGDSSTAASSEAKPKRRWWRRSFSKG